MAAQFIQEKSGFRLDHKKNDDSVVKDAFWGYNGRAYGSADKSPYVMNKFDDQHQDMHIHGTVLNEAGKRIHINNVDKKMGAFTFYQQLKEAFQ